MPIVDFKEIPEAHIASGKQDTFELFCQEFMKYMGMEIISSPDRGADGGADLICKESRTGTFGVSEVIWLVSCKHKAHSGNSVTPTDEQNIRDRLEQHNANGFIGFYSTLPSAGLNTRLENYKENFEIMVLNSEEIEDRLLESPRGRELFKRFFGNSFEKWNRNTIKAAKLFNEYEPLACTHCGKDILSEEVLGNKGALIGMVRDTEFSKANDYHIDKFVDIYFACKGKCDRSLEHSYFKTYGHISGWKDLEDLMIPVEYMRWMMSWLNNYQEKKIIVEEKAFDNLKIAIMTIGQFVMRDLTDKEVTREEFLNTLPGWIR